MSQPPIHSATERIRLQPAPGGLALVQDLLNTRDIGGKVPDLLATVDAARDWLAEAIDSAPGEPGWVPDLSGRELTELRTLRADVVRLLSGDSIGAVRPVAVTALVVDAGGGLRLEPEGRGARRFAVRVWTQIFLAQQAGTWKRLKLCHHEPCSSAFYDRSKNNSGVWHDVKMCGNVVNLRASRARRRESAGQPGSAVGRPRTARAALPVHAASDPATE